MTSQYSDSVYAVGQHGVLSGEDLSRYSNKTESVGLRKYPHYHHPTKKVKSP